MSEQKYPPYEDGRWYQPIRRGYRAMCCDCGLVHIMDFRVRNGRVQFRLFRDGRATANARRRTKPPLHNSPAWILDPEEFNALMRETWQRKSKIGAPDAQSDT